MKTIKKSALKEGYFYEEKSWYDALPETLKVPEYKTEIFAETLSHKEILEKYKIESYQSIEDAFAVAADSIPTPENDYKGRLVYFMDGETRYRLGVSRGSDGRLRVYVDRVGPDDQWDAGRGVLFSNETLSPGGSVDTLALGRSEPLTLSDETKNAITLLKSQNFRITRIESKEVEY